MRPIVIAYHLIWTVYGVWLPNDPRGSSSACVRSDVLAELGELHHGRRRVQPAGWSIRRFHDRATPFLKHPLVMFSEPMVDIVATAFAETVAACKYTCYTCAILPDPVHLVLRKHRDSAEAMIANLQRDSHLRLRKAGRYDLDHPV